MSTSPFFRLMANTVTVEHNIWCDYFIYLCEHFTISYQNQCCWITKPERNISFSFSQSIHTSELKRASESKLKENNISGIVKAGKVYFIVHIWNVSWMNGKYRNGKAKQSNATKLFLFIYFLEKYRTEK